MTPHGNPGPRFRHSEIDTFTTNGTDHVILYSSSTFPYHDLNGSFISKKSREFYETPQAFDIETTNVMCDNPYSFMYLWQACIDGYVVMGRTWNEFLELLSGIKYNLHLGPARTMIIYVHNLSFEFQFIKTILPIIGVFARGRRKILKAYTDGFEFRCSYFLSNMSLERFTEKEGTIYRKVTENLNEDILHYDYKKYRTALTLLTETELSYGCNDVLGLYESVNHLMKENGDNIITIPLTSTGYVRRDVRKSVQSTKHRNLCRRLALNLEQYTLLKEAFRGGNTHANYNYVGQILENMDSYDISSSYPFVMMTDKFPMTPFQKAHPSSINRLREQGKALLFRIRLENLRLKNIYDIPYIPVSKTTHRSNVLNDNGRVLRADLIEMAVTDIDMTIIEKQYSYDKIYIKDLYYADYGYLPSGIRETILSYFEKKTSLKGVEGKEYYYAKSKNSLNSIFGMMVTDILMEEYMYDSDTYEIYNSVIDQQKQLDAYYNSYNLFLAYQWGVWVTAHARRNLESLFDAMGDTKVYGDTDSSKGFDVDTESIEALNRKVLEKAKSAPIIPRAKDKDGNWVYMGIYEYDAHYERFITWGAKKYAYEQIKKGKLKTYVTVAGLSKKKGSEKLTADGLESFKPGWTVSPSGNLTAYYRDTPLTSTIDGEKEIIPSYVALFDSSYELSITKEYEKIINMC